MIRLSEALGVEWVHVRERGKRTGTEMVFLPADADIALDRAPRQRLELRADGTARLMLLPAPADRPTEFAGRWTDEEGDIVIRAENGRSFRVVSASRKRLTLDPLP